MNKNTNANYKILLFDADETLLDFESAQYDALTNLFQMHDFQLTDEILEQYNILNINLWRAYERGEITRDEVLNTRFERLFHELGHVVDGVLFEKEYHLELNKGHKIIPGSIELLDQLQDSYDLYIVTNGVADTQYERLTASGLLPYFKEIFVSEVAGYQKPRIEFFEYAFDRIPNFNPKEALIIGDSLSSDMQGGINVGIDTCWYNPKRLENTLGLPITYEIHELKDLLNIVSK